MSRKGNPYDNAQLESFIKTLKSEEVYLWNYRTFEHSSNLLKATWLSFGSIKKATQKEPAKTRITCKRFVGIMREKRLSVSKMTFLHDLPGVYSFGNDKTFVLSIKNRLKLRHFFIKDHDSSGLELHNILYC
jgi:transposase InsO family protein